ncbi:hypothetical protein BH10CYA1_BH10CYA1_18470 [soil metagenome]
MNTQNNPRKIEISKEAKVFRMLGSMAEVISLCKSALAAAGFAEFVSYGNNFVCSRQVEGMGRAMVIVQVETLRHDLCELTFRHIETDLPTVNCEMINKKLSRIQSYLETQVA